MFLGLAFIWQKLDPKFMQDKAHYPGLAFIWGKLGMLFMQDNACDPGFCANCSGLRQFIVLHISQLTVCTIQHRLGTYYVPHFCKLCT